MPFKTYEEYHAITNSTSIPNVYNTLEELIFDNQNVTTPIYVKKVVKTESIIAVYNVDTPIPPNQNGMKLGFVNDSIQRNKRVGIPQN